MQRTPIRDSLGAAFATMLLVAACGGGAATPTPPAASVVVTPPPSGGAPTTAPVATRTSTGEPALDAPAGVGAGATFEVIWTGPNEQSDYVTIVKLGATQWTDEDYFNTTAGSPGKLLASTEPGDYELWYVAGASKEILARRPIKILAFVGSLDAAASTEANKEFEVSWTGPNGPGDYITIVKMGATQWTNEDYFNSSAGNPGTLLAPLDAGPYELWYVTGTDRVIQVRRPITVTATSATLDASAEVSKGAAFQVSWTGPNGPSDYVTIVPAGSPPSTFLSYFTTNSGSPGTLTAPNDTGNYEIWYVVGQNRVTLATRPIRVR
jgi:Ca-activated chloride channel family protein